MANEVESDDSIYSGLGSEPDSEEDDVEYDESTGEDDRDRLTTAEDDTDVSDEEDARNTVGNIPLEWYNDYPHIGYDLDGHKILKPATKDELDAFLEKMDNPDYWRTVKDSQTGLPHVLTDDEVNIIQRIQQGQFPDSAFDPHEPYVDFFTHETMLHPLRDAPEPKRRFIRSKWEDKQVVKIVRAIRNGWIKPRRTEAEKPRFYDIWGKDDQTAKVNPMHMPAPKMKLPGHAESYNPPAEYLPTKEEIEKWMAMDPEDRPSNFLPKKYSNLRSVPAYADFIPERFGRCLDLYLCPRQRKIRLQVDPNDLVPKLPKPRDLQPFPSTEAIVYHGHRGVVRSISFEPSGQWFASGSDDCTVRFWEVATGRCVKCLQLDEAVQYVAWCPNSSMNLVLVACGRSVLVVNPGLVSNETSKAIDKQLKLFTPSTATDESALVWQESMGDDFERGTRFVLPHGKIVNQVTWHGKGDYFASLCKDAGSSARNVHIHQLSKRRSQYPFSKLKGLPQCILFHPSRPFFFLATQQYVRVYNLMKQELTKKLMSGVKWISSMDVHPQGDNLIIGSYDVRLCWFDMDLSTKPYKVLRHHRRALRQVAFHRSYPLFASAADDGTVIICHGMVYNDLLKNPLIVPVKVLKGHSVVNDRGVIDCQFHPQQPWILTAGADKTIRLFS